MTTDHHSTALSRAEIRYEKSLAQLETMLPRWRTPERRHLLSILVWVCIAAMTVVSIGSYLFTMVAVAWIPLALVSVTAWTMLRITTDAKDTAPPRFLDELEQQWLLELRSTALKVVTGAILPLAMVLIFASSLGIGDPIRLGYSAGGLLIALFFAGCTIPVSGLVRRMDENLMDEKPTT